MASIADLLRQVQKSNEEGRYALSTVLKLSWLKNGDNELTNLKNTLRSDGESAYNSVRNSEAGKKLDEIYRTYRRIITGQ